MQIWVLGPLEATESDGPLPITGAMPRRLLALLALSPGQVVGVDRIIDGLWGDSPPGAAPATLQSHVARLRRALGGHDVLRTVPGGYQLAVAPETVDAVRFQHALDAGRAALRDGDAGQARTQFEAALATWRGTPYAEFAGCVPLDAESERLSVLRMDMLEARLTADLELPGTSPPVAELEALVRWHPTRESFWALLMCALYRAGRQGDALAAYQRARRVLADELGVEPGPLLTGMEQRVLAQDRTLEVADLPLPGLGGTGDSYAQPVTLVERADQLAAVTVLFEKARGGGQLAVVHGEAGAGKSALVRGWASGLDERGVRLLRGCCDPLIAPRPLGPLADIAARLDAGVARQLASESRDGLFDAVLAALENGPPTVLVIEDLQWADSSTLDLLRYLTRRLDGARGLLLVVTLRDDQVPPTHPVRVLLGDLATLPWVHRVGVPPLSPTAVAELVGDTGIDPATLHLHTGGNAFLVTEVIASGGAQVPSSVQDSVLARVHRLSPAARRTVESAAVIGARVEPALLRSMPDVTPETTDECVSSGILHFEAPTYGFRHELVRQSVLAGISPARLGVLHWQVLDRLRTTPMWPTPYARLAEHAERAGDAAAVLEYAIPAGDAAAALGSHTEASQQYGRAMPYADLLDAEALMSLLRKRAMECYLTDEQSEAVVAWRRLIAMLRERDRPRELADALVRCARCEFTSGHHTAMAPLIDEAIDVATGLAPSPELAVALAFRAGNAGAAGVATGERAVAIARALGDPDTLSYALNSLACCLVQAGDPTSETLLREGLRIALEHDLEDATARAYNNLAFIATVERRYDDAMAVMEDAITYTTDHDLDGNLLCLLASRATLRLGAGEWAAAEADSHDLLDVRQTARASRMDPLLVLGLLAARRGDADEGWRRLDEARDHVKDARDLGYEAPIALAYGEAHLLQGDHDAVERAVRPTYERALEEGDAESAGYLALLLRRAGRAADPPPDAPECVLLSAAGEHRLAAQAWRADGLPYDAAWALYDGDDEADLLEARAVFERFGAVVPSGLVDAKLRSLGARVPRGPRPSTRSNPAGLTGRELEVLELLHEGLRNAEIAERLHLSTKTVDHHVSAILAKLGATSRLDAVRRTRELAG